MGSNSQPYSFDIDTAWTGWTWIPNENCPIAQCPNKKFTSADSATYYKYEPEELESIAPRVGAEASGFVISDSIALTPDGLFKVPSFNFLSVSIASGL